MTFSLDLSEEVCVETLPVPSQTLCFFWQKRLAPQCWWSWVQNHLYPVIFKGLTCYCRHGCTFPLLVPRVFVRLLVKCESQGSRRSCKYWLTTRQHLSNKQVWHQWVFNLYWLEWSSFIHWSAFSLCFALFFWVGSKLLFAYLLISYILLPVFYLVIFPFGLQLIMASPPTTVQIYCC